MTTTFLSPTILARAALADVSAGTAIAGVVVMTNEREEGDTAPYILLSEGGDLHAGTLQANNPARVQITGVAATDVAAVALCRTALALLHDHGPASYTIDGLAYKFHGAANETGVQQPLPEPETTWWRAFGVIDIWMPDRATS